MSFPRYPEYKDSGVEWLGEVPAHWSVSPLGGLCEQIQTGPFGSQLHAEDYIDGGVPVINPSNIVVDAGVFADPSCTVAGGTAERLAAHKLTAGDIVFARRGEMGRCAIVTENEAGWLCGTGSLNVRLRNKISAPFTARFLSTAYTRELLKLVSVGSTMDNLNTSILARVRVPAPPIAEQTTIAAFLDRETGKIDALVAEQEKLIALLKEKRHAVISHAVTKGLNPDAPMKPSGIEWLGDVPAHWEVGSLKRFWSVTDCKHITAEFVDEGIPLASIREVQSQYVDLERAKRTTDEFYEQLIEGGREPQAGDLIFSRNATVGEVAQVPVDHERFAMGQDVCLLRRLDSSFSPDYMRHIIRSTVVVEQINTLMIGSTFKRVNVEEIRALSVPCPPAPEQVEIGTHLSARSEAFDDLIAEATDAITLLKERRSALISAAVTGQIDVRGLVSGPVAAAAEPCAVIAV